MVMAYSFTFTFGFTHLRLYGNFLYDSRIEAALPVVVICALAGRICAGLFIGLCVTFYNDLLSRVALLDDIDDTVVLLACLYLAEDTHVHCSERADTVTRDSRETTVTPVDFARGIAVGTRGGTHALPVEDMVVNEGALIVGAL